MQIFVLPGTKICTLNISVAEAARDFGVTDDRLRLAKIEEAMCKGQKVGNREISVAVAAKAARLKPAALLKKARSLEMEKRVRTTTAEFRALRVTQRPTFVLDSNIGDRAIFSGLLAA